jgi:hypothetical protein
MKVSPLTRCESGRLAAKVLHLALRHCLAYMAEFAQLRIAAQQYVDDAFSVSPLLPCRPQLRWLPSRKAVIPSAAPQLGTSAAFAFNPPTQMPIVAP